MDKAVVAPPKCNTIGASFAAIAFPPLADATPTHPSLASSTFSDSHLPHGTANALSPSKLPQSHADLASIVQDPANWVRRFPELHHSDVAFLLNHPSGRNLSTHLCMGVAYTSTFRTADHTRVAPHTLLAVEIGLEMANRLRLHPDDTRDVIAAVAGHDQGHIFASHQSENAINSFPAFDGTPGRPKFCHEVRTKELFSSDDFVREFGVDRTKRIKSILYDSKNPLHLIVDWSDRLAYLIADTIHLGIDNIARASSIRQEFIQSLEMLPDGTIGFNNLTPLRGLIHARDMLYRRVAESPTSTLFKGFLLEAYHRAVRWNKTTPTEFVRKISELPTPEARKLFHPSDQPRLYCPQQDPRRAKPVDLDFTPVAHLTLDMLSEPGKATALRNSSVDVARSTPACSSQRAGMNEFELLVRSHFSKAGGAGYLERIGAVIGTAYMPAKRYHVREQTSSGTIKQTLLFGTEHWEFFVAVPKDRDIPIGALHRDICSLFIHKGLIKSRDEDLGTAVTKLQRLPAADLFTRG